MSLFIGTDDQLHPAIQEHLKREGGRTIRNAAKLLETRGWVRGHMASGERLCTIGAVSQFMTGNPWGESMVGNRALVQLGTWLKDNGLLSEEILAAIPAYSYPMIAAVFRWNDAAHDEWEVITTLRKFADEMDPQHV